MPEDEPELRSSSRLRLHGYYQYLSVQKSIDLFRHAIIIDPGYAAAWSGLADSWILAGSYGDSFLAPQVAMPKAKEEDWWDGSISRSFDACGALEKI